MIWTFIVGDGFTSPANNPMLGPPVITFINVGGLWVPEILYAGQWWRFISSIFIHAGLIHIGMNLLAQTKLAYDLEKVHGTWRLVPIYFLSGVGGMALSAVFLPDQVTIGASGAIFGLDSLLLIDLIKNWDSLHKRGRKLALIIFAFVISFALGLLPGLNNFAHLGGVIVSILSGIVFLPSMYVGRWSVKRRLIQVGIALPLLIGYFLALFIPFYHGISGQSFCSWCHYFGCLPVWPSCG